MTFEEYSQKLTTALKTLYGSGEARAIARLVLEHFTEDRYRLLSKENIPENQLAKSQHIQDELLTGKPVQYVLGEAWFLGRKFWVNESVLIPRPETEELVMLTIETIKQKGFQDKPITILDIGTGSGCIAISLTLTSKAWSVTGMDVSPDALKVANHNSKMLSANVNWQQADFLNPANWDAFSNYEVIVSNPPYIPLAEKAILDKNVTDWEPGLALFTPDDDPLIFYRKLALFGKQKIKTGGFLAVEGHQQYLEEVAEILNETFGNVLVKKDLNNNPRMAIATRG